MHLVLLNWLKFSRYWTSLNFEVLIPKMRLIGIEYNYIKLKLLCLID